MVIFTIPEFITMSLKDIANHILPDARYAFSVGHINSLAPL